MLRVTRDKAKLGDTPFVTFRVYRSPKDNTTVCGYHEFAYLVAGDRVRFHHTPFGIPVAEAFEETCRFAVWKGVSVIWIDDPDHLFEPEQTR